MNPLLLGALASIFATSQAVSGDLRPLELEKRIGVVWSPPGQPCAAFRVRSAELGLAVTEVWFPLGVDEAPVRVESGRLGAPVDECGLWGRPGYLLTYRGPYGAEAALPHLVIIGRALRPVAHRGYLEIDLIGGGTPETLRACTSQEGIHFTVWEGAPLRGKLLHHEYQPLGIDLVPECTPAEMPP